LTAYAQAKGISLLIDANRVPIVYAASSWTSRKTSSPITTERIRPEPLLPHQRRETNTVATSPDAEESSPPIGFRWRGTRARRRGHRKGVQPATSAESREVRHVDVLNYTNKLFRHLYSKAYIDLVNKMPEVPGWFYDKLDKPWKNERRRLALDNSTRVRL
jgi:hypothetical protein